MQNRQQTISARLEEYLPALREDVKYLHENPETANQEYDTTAFLTRKMAEMGIEVLPTKLETGLIAVIHGRPGGKTVGLRSDIDGLPVTEVPLGGTCSQRPGKMHACGHDAHMGALLGAAYALQQMKDSFTGDVVLVFQPAEEVGQGSRRILREGTLQSLHLDAMFGAHVFPNLPVGQIGLCAGPAMGALLNFSIVVRGKGAHAAMPHCAHDPVVASAAVVTALQTIASRRLNAMEPFLLSLCSIHGGTACNVIPDEVELKGSIRFANNDLFGQIQSWLEEISAAAAATYECTTSVTYLQEQTALVNSPELESAGKASAEAVVGAENVKTLGFWMVSEDFSYYDQLCPVWFYFSGCRTEQMQSALHSPLFHAYEPTILQSARLLAQSALEILDAE